MPDGPGASHPCASMPVACMPCASSRRVTLPGLQRAGASPVVSMQVVRPRVCASMSTAAVNSGCRARQQGR